MAAGKAHGKDREYQVLCRDILQAISKDDILVPYSGDGIDVRFNKLGGSNVTFDVALRNSSGRLVVAECRRRKERVKQEAIFAFARKVELLRKQTGGEVAGVFFAREQYQVGAVKHASWSEIAVAVLDQDQSGADFALVYHRYDPKRDKRLREGLAHMTGGVSFTKSLAAKVTRHDGSEEDLGEVR